ncbi:DNA-binding protein [Pseudorhodoferax aquiterrae]|uniref:DNA-binding protein n=1 Tax=Pseudorhodoferax aquiterrae TaxID=747304 RepID=A0ABQ3G9V4_9BURK|nr:type II toxin-antitoxin system VapC family toxin [Pseudorhodoferax aquiterrae]GHC98136.1 DNA-binding protein [Pseudorhodoferax aquiterrae]
MAEHTPRVAEPDARYLAPPATLIDSNVLIDVLADDPQWADWSLEQLARLGDEAALVINPLVLAELSPRFERAAELEAALAGLPLRRDALPWDAAFLAGQAFRAYRAVPGAADGRARSPLPDFYIGAHATVAGLRLLTRDARRYRHYFPRLDIICP